MTKYYKIRKVKLGHNRYYITEISLEKSSFCQATLFIRYNAPVLFKKG
jgi:hypothetical protein